MNRAGKLVNEVFAGHVAHASACSAGIRAGGLRNQSWTAARMPLRHAKACATSLAAVLCVLPALAHETLTTTVLFDREIVRIIDKHCVMCHVENGASFPLGTYEQAWLQKRQIRADVIARHMPPWSAVPGYGQFANDNSLTLRETQFIVSWVEGLGPRNAGTVFLNVTDASSARTKEVRAHVDFGHWQLGEPQLTRQLSANTMEAQAPNQVKRTVIDLHPVLKPGCPVTFPRPIRKAVGSSIICLTGRIRLV